MGSPQSGNDPAETDAAPPPEPRAQESGPVPESNRAIASARAAWRSVRVHRRKAAPLSLALALVAVATGHANFLRSTSLPAPATDVARLEAENRALRIEIELAAGDQPYLVTDLAEPSLTLKSRGVPLRSFPVQATRVRSRRFLGIWTRAMPVLDTVWEGSALLPPRKLERLVILSDTVTPPDKDGSVEFIPPTPEEENPTFPFFRIRFEGGLSAMVVAGPVEPLTEDSLQTSEVEAPEAPVMARTSVLGRIALWIGMKPWRRDHTRIELTMPPSEAGALYRAITDGTPLLVIGTP